MVIKRWVEVDCAITSANDEVVRSWLNEVHYFERMRLDLKRVIYVPHEVSIREYNHATKDPVVVDQEVAV